MSLFLTLDTKVSNVQNLRDQNETKKNKVPDYINFVTYETKIKEKRLKGSKWNLKKI